MLSFLRPKPTKFLLQALPLYFGETDKAIKHQEFSVGGRCMILGADEAFTECVIIGRSLNVGCAISAHRLAKDLSGIAPPGGESAHKEFLALMDGVIFKNLDDKLGNIVSSNSSHFLKMSRDYRLEVSELTKKHIVDSTNVEEWQIGLGTLYADVTNRFKVQAASPDISSDDLKKILVSYCSNFGVQSYSILNTLATSLESLMRAKKSTY